MSHQAVGPPSGGTTGPVTVRPVTGVGEVTSGTDLAAALLEALGPGGLRDGDLLVVTSKVVSKAEGRVVAGGREESAARETDRVVARRGPTSIVRTHHGLVMANAGIDASNTPVGTVVLLPVDPDASARALRARVADATGCNVAVVITDTSGRAWRHGQTDIAVGAAGLDAIQDYAGHTDTHGNLLAVTAPAVADEVAGAADLVKGKVAGVPAAVVRGLDRLVLPPGSPGSGARAVVREEATDMFGLGAREAVMAALAGDVEALRGFGAPATTGDLARAFTALGAVEVREEGQHLVVRLPGTPVAERAHLAARLSAAAFAHGWIDVGGAIEGTPPVRRFLRHTP